MTLAATAARRHQHRAREVLGQARRRAQPARHRQPVADARRLGTRTTRRASTAATARAIGSRSTARRPTREGRRARDARSSIACARAPGSRARAEVVDRQQRADGGGARLVGVGLRGAGAGGVARGRAGRCRRRSCRSWRGSARARRRARSSAASSRWRAARAPTARDAVARAAREAGDGLGRMSGLVVGDHRRGREGARLDGGDGAHGARPRPTTRRGSRRRRPICRGARRDRARATWPRLGAVAERSALRMHASALAAEPAILYWNPATLAAMARGARRCARAASPAFFTIDAGPHVKVLCAGARRRAGRGARWRGAGRAAHARSPRPAGRAHRWRRRETARRAER